MTAGFLRRFPLEKVGRWALVAVGVMSVNLPSLYVLVDVGRLPVPVATLITSGVGSLLRFLANDRFVFRQKRPTWRRFRAYLGATALSVVVWYAVVNTLTFLGVYYLLSAIAATGCSVGFSLASNFLWVWRGRKTDLLAEARVGAEKKV